MRVIIFLLLVFMHSSLSMSFSKCNTQVNDNKDEKLRQQQQLAITQSKYYLTFGLPPMNQHQNKTLNSNRPIGYSIEAECYSTLTKKQQNQQIASNTKTYNSYDLPPSVAAADFDSSCPVEVTVSNCSSGLVGIDLDFKYSSLDQLRFVVDLSRSRIDMRNLTFFIHLKLSVNRKFGNGCSAALILYPSSHSLFDLSHLFAFDHIFEYSESLTQRLVHYWRFFITAATNPFCVYSLLVIALLLVLACLITIICLARNHCLRI